MPELNEYGYFPLALRNGELVPQTSLSIHCDSQAMRYALSVFEGVRGYKQAKRPQVELFALDEHLARMSASLELVKLPSEAPVGFRAALARLLQENRVDDDCYLRLAASAAGMGDLQREVSLVWTASLCPMGRKPWLAGERRMSVSISRWQKPADNMFPQAAKNISNYSGPRIALIEAKAAGFDMTILRSREGKLSEAPTANLFLVCDGVLCTPKLSDGVLAGITRRWVLSNAPALGIAVEERSLVPEDAYGAQEAFLCGTGLEFARIGSFDGRQLPETGPLLPRLVARYFEAVRDQKAPRLPASSESQQELHP